MSSSNKASADKSYRLRRFKEFEPQESLFTTYLESHREFQTLYACLMAFVHVYLTIQVITYILDGNKFREDMQFLHWSFVETFPSFFLSWTQLFLLTALFHPVTLIWRNGFLPSPLFMLILIGYVIVTTMIAAASQFSGTLMSAIACEHTRMMMKVLAFVIAQKKKTDSEPATSFSHYIYFLFVPTLVFRESYPRTKSINWKRIAALLYYFVLHVYFVFMVVRHWVAPVFRDVGLRPLNFKEWISFQRSAYAMVFVLHYGAIGCALVHCWMNIFAELLTFADRNFYGGWWMANNPPDQLRKWNSPVGDWIYEYAYTAIVYVTAGNKIVSAISIYILSALIHDYVLNMMFGLRFLPIMTITYGGLGSTVLFFIMAYHKFRWNRFFGGFILSNTACHFSNGLAFVIWINIYAMEFYCRKNVPREETSFLDAISPRSFSCVKFE